MLFMMKVEWDIEAGNALARSGELGAKVGAILEESQPEAAYFTALNGRRGGYIIVNVDDASQMPALAEPWFLTANARVEFEPLMQPADLERAGPSIDAAVAKFG